MNQDERAVFLHIEGRVQGVGYRAFTRDEARARGIRGWVVNRPDGSVEAVLCGEGGKLADLIARLRQGPGGARVDGLDVRSTDAGAAQEPPPNGLAF